MRQPGATDQQVRRIRVVERRQNPQVLEQLRIVMSVAKPTLLNLPSQIRTRLDRRQRQLAHALGADHFTHLITVNQPHPTLTVAQFKLH